MNSVEILDKKQQLKDEANAILDNCKQEIRMLNPDEQNKIEEIKQEINSLNEELRKMEETVELPQEINLIKTDKTMSEKNFSLIRAIRNVANNKALDSVDAAVVECGQEEMRKAGLNYVGQVQLPNSEYRTITVATEHDDVIATDLFDVVKPLNAKNVLIQAGAKYITGLVGDIQYPVMSSINTTWEGEVSEAGDGTPTFSNVKLSPKRLTTVVPISKQFIAQDSVGAERAIREEIINAINSKLEATILGSAAGSTTQPAGIFYTATSLDTISDYGDICDLEAEVENSNVYGEMKYIISPRAKAALRSMVKTGTNNGLVWENGEIDGTPALSTSNVKVGNIAYGDWSNYIIGQWGNIDLTVDTMTLAASGQIRLVVNAYFDAKPLRTAAIKVAKIAGVSGSGSGN